MPISKTYWRFFLVDQGVIPAVINFLIVGGIAWAMFGKTATLPMFGTTSVAAELLATGFLLPLITCLIAGRLVRMQVRRGQLPPLPLEHFPRGSWHRKHSPVQGVLFGGAGLLIAGVSLLGVRAYWPGDVMESSTFILFKAFWGAGLGVLVTPLIGWWAWANTTERLAKLAPAGPEPQR